MPRRTLMTMFAFALLVTMFAPLSGSQADARGATPTASSILVTFALDASWFAVPGGIPQLGYSVAQPGWRLNQAFPFASPIMLSVVSGALTVRSDGPITVIHNGAASAAASDADVPVAAGDTAVVRSGVRTQQRNDGDVPAEYYWMIITARKAPTIDEKIGDSSGDIIGGLGPDQWSPPASGTVTVTLRTGVGETFPDASQVIAGSEGGQQVELAFTPGTSPGAAIVDLSQTSTTGATPTAGASALPALLQAWIDAQIARDPYAFAALYAQDGVYADATASVSARGYDEILERARFTAQSQEDITIEVHAVHASDDWAALEYGISFGDRRSGQRLSFEVATIFELSGSTIARSTDYYDASAALVQLGELQPATPEANP